MKRKNVFKWRLCLIINYIKTGMLFLLWLLWAFSPGFLVLLIPEGVAVLGWVCLIGVYFNFHLSGKKDFIINKWLIDLEHERDDWRYMIMEEKNEIKQVGNIRIRPFGK